MPPLTWNEDVQARLISRPAREAFVRRDATSNGLPSAAWIWATNANGSTSTSPGNVAFLKTFTTPSGKAASTAMISMTAVDQFTLWVNGHPIGASVATQDGWKSPQMLRAELNETVNVFSVLVENSVNPAQPSPGLLAAVEVTFNDTTTSTFLSDNSWLASSTIPSDFPTPANPSQFTAAGVAAQYGSGSWGQNVTLPPVDPNPLTLTGSTWVWSTAGSTSTSTDAVVAFRKTLSTSGKTPQTAAVLLTVDNFFTLYLNGVYIGSPPPDGQDPNSNVWRYAQQFTVALDPTANVLPPTPPPWPHSSRCPTPCWRLRLHRGSWESRLGTDSMGSPMGLPPFAFLPPLSPAPVLAPLRRPRRLRTCTLSWRSRSRSPTKPSRARPSPAKPSRANPFPRPPPASVFLAEAPAHVPRYPPSASEASGSVYAPSSRPLPVPRPGSTGKVDPETVMRMNGMRREEAELPPPSYSYSDAASALGASSER
ncbi:hypothetical protein B0H17DRAFT_1066628 [Mycena rosella]|uniref:Uncharacterized protein n=1 Tax=Mycena rosella TaxID=1033263 RepID=A0AAD7DET6_MYCRO|nr:hypothetical protein B0H17DRAFT_1066628 [Mycena rosella]